MRINLIPAVLISVVTFVVFRAAYLRWASKPARVGLVLVAAVLMVPGVWFVSNYLLLIPCADWFIEFHALPGVEALSGLVGGMLGIMFASSKLRPDPLNRPVLLVCGALALGLVITPFVKQLFFSVTYYGDLKSEWNDGVCLQSTGYTCVPACCVTVIRLLGGSVTEPELARAAGSCVGGTECWYMKRALRKRGYELTFVNIRKASEAPVHSIVGVKVGSLGHVVVFLDKDKRGVTVGEPLSGRKYYTWSKFQRRYNPERMCFVITKRR